MERLAQLYGERWIWLSFDPVHKIVSAFVAGKINRANVNRLLQQTKAVNDESLHIFFSDQRPHYQEAIFSKKFNFLANFSPLATRLNYDMIKISAP